MAKNAGLQSILLKSVQAFLMQTSHTAISNARSHIDARLARWILMGHDRVHGSTIPLTDEFLALMLVCAAPGSRRRYERWSSKGLSNGDAARSRC